MCENRVKCGQCGVIYNPHAGHDCEALQRKREALVCPFEVPSEDDSSGRKEVRHRHYFVR